MLTELKQGDTDLKLDDLYLCAFLACKGIKPQGLETTGFGRRHFVYSDDAKQRVNGLVQGFYSGEVEVSLPILRNYIKDMKELMRSER